MGTFITILIGITTIISYILTALLAFLIILIAVTIFSYRKDKKPLDK